MIARTARARASYLAALQSTRAIPDRGVFYVADPISSIPDLWQQEAVRALQQGNEILLRQSSLRSRFGGVGGYGGTSVVVHAPTASR